MLLLVRIFTFLGATLYQALRPYFWFINRHPPKRVPSPQNPILKLSATVVAEKIRRRELTCEAVVSAYVDRIKEVNPLLNAVIEDRFDAAIQEARERDEKLANGEVTAKQLEAEQPLYGVPLTVKESCAVKGLSHTGGSLARIGVKANYDGTAVEVLKKAGVIILCVTNTPELCLGFETSNCVFGVTNNPYDVRRTAGGSSGGEGSLLGCAGSLLGIGSDIAGSVRVPAHFNGVFGHKPTPRVISIEGHFPNSDEDEFKTWLTIGPLTRYADDLALAVRVMADRNSASLRLDVPVDVKSLKVRYMEQGGDTFGLIPVSDEVKQAIRKAAGYLDGVGADVEKVHIEEMKDSLDVSLAIFFNACNLPPMLLNPDDPKHEHNTFIEIGKWLLGTSGHPISAMVCSLVRDVKAFVPRSQIPAFKADLKKLQRIFADLLGDDGVFLYPTCTSSAPFHGHLVPQLAGPMYPMIFNVLGLPATHVPMGFNSEGMPIGIQVVAGPMQDRLSLAVAKELEKGFGGWIPQPNTAQH